MSRYEIPYEQDRHGWYRFFEVLPGLLSYGMLALPIALSLINVTLAAVFIFIYLCCRIPFRLLFDLVDLLLNAIGQFNGGFPAFMCNGCQENDESKY